MDTDVRLVALLAVFAVVGAIGGWTIADMVLHLWLGDEERAI